MGPRHSTVAKSLNNIGTVFNDMKKYTEAISFFRKSLEIEKETLGEIHSATARSLNNIGVAYYKMGSFEEALDYHLRSLAIR